MTAERGSRDLPHDLGFAYVIRKNGDAAILRLGRPVVLIKGAKASAFAAQVSSACAADAQQLMARVTGNYKRGNERMASASPKRVVPGNA